VLADNGSDGKGNFKGLKREVELNVIGMKSAGSYKECDVALGEWKTSAARWVLWDGHS